MNIAGVKRVHFLKLSNQPMSRVQCSYHQVMTCRFETGYLPFGQLTKPVFSRSMSVYFKVTSMRRSGLKRQTDISTKHSIISATHDDA